MDALDKAFALTPRRNFVPEPAKHIVGLDAPVPIGFGQTNSQPSTVRMMLEWLEPQQGDKVLDIGSGSGWTTALLAKLVEPNGKVDAVELVPELVKFGRGNVARLGIKNAKFHKAGKDYGLPNHAPYDRILVSAAAELLPLELLDQLKPGGKLVIPVRHDILEIAKLPSGRTKTTVHPGFIFVPLLKQR